jgi:hypothetical protein
VHATYGVYRTANAARGGAAFRPPFGE